MEIKDNFKYEWISDSQEEQIREFVYGIFAGIAISGKTRDEICESENYEYWFNWNCDIEVHIFKDDITDAWQVTTYQCNDLGQFFGNEFKKIELEEKWQ